MIAYKIIDESRNPETDEWNVTWTRYVDGFEQDVIALINKYNKEDQHRRKRYETIVIHQI